MSAELVERIRRGYEHFNRGDFESAAKGFHPDIEWIVFGDLPMDRTYRRIDDVRRFWEAWHEIFDDFHAEIEECIDAGDSVVALVRMRGQGGESGAEVVTPSFPQVWTVRDGLVVRVEMMPSRSAALDAVGLGEQQARR